jgi:hypothetical protein
MTIRPELTSDAENNRRILQKTLDTSPGGELELPRGEWSITDGLRVPDGWTIRGAEVVDPAGEDPATTLVSVGTTGHPVLHVVGSDVAISDLGLKPPPADPGEHGGDRGTGITIGDYLYESAPAWIQRVEVRRVYISRPGERHANCIAIMGAVREIDVRDVTIRGGYTGVAVHWGAVGADVASIVGPTFHPHRLSLTGLRVRDAVEGFYLSSVHDVQVSSACLRDVEMGFRLLPGDNTNRLVPSAYTGPAATDETGHTDTHPSLAVDIGSRIEIADCCVAWNGPRYGIRVAGWGRSEVDGLVTVLNYQDTLIRDCTVVGTGSGDAWSPIIVEQAAGVEFRSIVAGSRHEDGKCCSLG